MVKPKPHQQVSKDPPTKKRKVEVVTCGAAFPISKNVRPDTRSSEQPKRRGNKNDQHLDWHKTAEEVRNVGASMFVKQQKHDYEDEQYKLLTGRARKKIRVPLPILRGRRKKAAEWEAKREQEAREAGIILPQKKKVQQKSDSTSRVHGPAPSIGYVAKGVFRMTKRKDR